MKGKSDHRMEPTEVSVCLCVCVCVCEGRGGEIRLGVEQSGHTEATLIENFYKNVTGIKPILYNLL